jgi:hypothetical protein
MKQILRILPTILFLFSQIYAQRMILDKSIEDKNQLFELLGVKKEIIHYRSFRMIDSTINSKSIQILFIDQLGFVIKKEMQYLNYINDYRSQSLLVFERDSTGNIVKIIEDGKLIETRVYNKMDEILHWDTFGNNKLAYTGTYQYDSLGNEILYFWQISENQDTIYAEKYKYDFKHSLPLEKIRNYSDTDKENTFLQYDSAGRITREFTEYSKRSIEDSTLYFYDDFNLKDSTIEYYDGNIQKKIRECDKTWRPLKITFYNGTDSLLEEDFLEYDDRGIELRDSIFIANSIEIKQKPYDEMMGEQIVAKMIVNGKISFTTTTSYFPNGLIKEKITTDFAHNSIDKTNYEYEFY